MKVQAGRIKKRIVMNAFFVFLFVCLVFNGTSTQDRSICAICGRVKPTQVAKDGQRDTRYNSQYVAQCNTDSKSYNHIFGIQQHGGTSENTLSNVGVTGK